MKIETDDIPVRGVAYYRTANRGRGGPAAMAAQRRRCREFIAKRGWILVGEFKDAGASGTSLDRPGVRDLLALLRQDRSIRTVVVSRLDRLTRSVVDFVNLRAAGTDIVCVANKSADALYRGFADQFLRAYAAFWSETRSQAVREGMQRARERRAAESRALGDTRSAADLTDASDRAATVANTSEHKTSRGHGEAA
jgi:DNA invertase Pin-like site-specific DNA recombinase